MSHSEFILCQVSLHLVIDLSAIAAAMYQGQVKHFTKAHSHKSHISSLPDFHSQKFGTKITITGFLMLSCGLLVRSC